MLKKFFLFVIFCCLWQMFFLVLPARADSSLYNNIMGQIQAGGQSAGIATVKPPQQVIAEIIQIALRTVGIVFIALIVYGGYKLITAGGNEEQAKKALSIIKPAIVGLLIILMAYGITLFVAAKFSQAAAGGILPGPF